MKQLLKNIYYFFPVQLFILHFRKYQILLIFWAVLFSTLDSGFLKYFGADALFFSPEYLGSVNILSALFTGMALGVFIMSWNITTFILHSHRFRFLATTSNLFLKYCINNGILPLIFLVFYFAKLYHYNIYIELTPAAETWVLMAGILIGFLLSVIISFAYFFGTGTTIDRGMAAIVNNPQQFAKTFTGSNTHPLPQELKVNYYLNAGLRLQKVRSTSHYRQSFIEAIFKKYHLAAIGSIVIAFVFLITVGFFLENKYFIMPAAASVLLFFGLMVAVIGSLVYFLQSWSLPGAILLLILVNFLYKKEIIDFRNKAYGLHYSNKKERPLYNQATLESLCDTSKIAADKDSMLLILEKWKAKQQQEKPVMVFINVSGGGMRSAAFTMNMLQQIDSLSGGKLMQRTFLISGASGGMLAATYYRELYRNKLYNPAINLHDKAYAENITQDLLNPIFTSLMARDIFASVQKFSIGDEKYLKDRGYAFEQTMDYNTKHVLRGPLAERAADEKEARVPLLIFNSVVKTDGRKMMVCTQPISFMMKPRIYLADSTVSADAIDFAALFKKQDPLQLRLLTAMRMNATFPYVLPNVWLPTNPIIDVMDAGLRDNFGQEMSLRFIENFKEWIAQNTGGVVILHLRDRTIDNWQQPVETKSFTEMLLTPGTMLQHNWYKMQDYGQTGQYNYFKNNDSGFVTKYNMQYIAAKQDNTAALNFHLTGREKRDVLYSYYHPINQEAIKGLLLKIK